MAVIKQNESEKSTELWLGGRFRVSWPMIEIPEESKAILESMLSYSVTHGKWLKMQEIKKVIGAK